MRKASSRISARARLFLVRDAQENGRQRGKDFWTCFQESEELQKLKPQQVEFGLYVLT